MLKTSFLQHQTHTCSKSTSLLIYLQVPYTQLCCSLMYSSSCEWMAAPFWPPTPVFLGVPGGSAGKEPACNVGDLGLIPMLGRSLREGNCYPLQYSSLKNSMDHTVHEVEKNWIRLSDFHFNFQRQKYSKGRKFSMDKASRKVKDKSNKTIYIHNKQIRDTWNNYW